MEAHSATETTHAHRGRPPALRLSRGEPRTLGAALAIAAGFVALLLLTSPMTSAAQVHPASTYAPPFHGKVATAKSLQYLGCGITAKISKGPSFSLTSGIEVLAEKTTAKPCGSPLGYNDVATGGNGGMWTKPFTGLSGAHQVVVHWTVHWTSILTAHLGAHQGNGASHASSFVSAILYLVDESNGTYLLPSNSWGSYSYTGNGTNTTASTALVSIHLNQTLLSYHTYAIATWIYASTFSFASSTGGSSSSASLVLTNAGGATKLTSVVLS
jgi:hypothetical protein